MTALRSIPSLEPGTDRARQTFLLPGNGNSHTGRLIPEKQGETQKQISSGTKPRKRPPHLQPPDPCPGNKKKKPGPILTGVELHSRLQNLSWKQELLHSADSGWYTEGWGREQFQLEWDVCVGGGGIIRQHGQWRTFRERHTEMFICPFPILHSPERAHSYCLHLLTTDTCQGSPRPYLSWRAPKPVNLVPRVSAYLAPLPSPQPTRRKFLPSSSHQPSPPVTIRLQFSAPPAPAPAPPKPQPASCFLGPAQLPFLPLPWPC